MRKILSFSILIISATNGCQFLYQKKQMPNQSLPKIDAKLISYRTVNERVFIPAKCIACHGVSGGVNLETYKSVIQNLNKIERTAIQERTMPKDGSLSESQRSLLEAWIQAGAPEMAADTETPEAVLTATYSSIRKQIFEKRCLTCHAENGNAHQVPLIPYSELLNSPRELVIPGNAEESGLMISILREDDKRMPPPTVGNRLTEMETEAIRKWIADGGKNDTD